jgi:DNA-binding HxlR family transcriptional regulator
MGSSANQDYCAFTKAAEHLGDRWSLLIIRELVMFGPQGFNQLAVGLPGTISRSVLAARLRNLEQIGVIARLDAGRHAPYLLAPAGKQLAPTLKSLWQWAEHWVPEDPAMAQRDPTVIMWWLTNRVDVAALPSRQVVLDTAILGADEQHLWLVMARGTEPTLCLEDPRLDQNRYVYIEADGGSLLPIARGARGWTDAIGDGSVRVYGDPELLAALPSWFLPTQTPAAARTTSEAHARAAA